MYEQIAGNKRKSFLLVFLFMALIFVLAWLFNQMVGMGRPGSWRRSSSPWR